MSSPIAPRSPKGKEPMRPESKPEDPEIKPTTPPRIGFGIELEFLIAERINMNRDPDADIADNLPPFVEVGTSQEAVMALLRSKGLPVTSNSDSNEFVPSEAFVVHRDATVTEAVEPETGYEWARVEIATPAQYATEEAFDLIRLLVSLITSKFRCRVNQSAGFHVHVSNGFDRIDGRHARKYAALLWAAEPILSMLHPTERAFGQWSLSFRRVMKVPLTRGTTADQIRLELGFGADLRREYGRARDYGDVPEPLAIESDTADLRVLDDKDNVDWEAQGYQPLQRPQRLDPNPGISGPCNLNLGRKTIKAGPPTIRHVAQKTNEYQFERTGARSDNFRPIALAYEPISDRAKPSMRAHTDLLAPHVTDSWSGIVELLSSDLGAHQVAKLICGGDGNRKNWNFDQWASDFCGLYAAWLPDDYINPEYLARRHQEAAVAQKSESAGNRTTAPATVEAREAVGSLDPDWIITWTKICIGLLEFSRDAEPSYFMSVLDKCANATDHGYPAYDVVDLLRDMGLFSEANHCEKRLARQEEAWFECLLFKKRDLQKAKEELPTGWYQDITQARRTDNSSLRHMGDSSSSGWQGEGSSGEGSSGLHNQVGDEFGDIGGVVRDAQMSFDMSQLSPLLESFMEEDSELEELELPPLPGRFDMFADVLNTKANAQDDAHYRGKLTRRDSWDNRGAMGMSRDG